MSVIRVWMSMIYTRPHTHAHTSAHFIVINWYAAIMYLVDKPIVRNCCMKRVRQARHELELVSLIPVSISLVAGEYSQKSKCGGCAGQESHTTGVAHACEPAWGRLPAVPAPSASIGMERHHKSALSPAYSWFRSVRAPTLFT